MKAEEAYKLAEEKLIDRVFDKDESYDTMELFELSMEIYAEHKAIEFTKWLIETDFSLNRDVVETPETAYKEFNK